MPFLPTCEATLSPDDLPEYRIFVSSPRDVAAERARARAVIDRLNGEYDGRLRLDPILWEEKTYGAHADFQAQIEATTTCHLVIGILWNRIGTALDAVRYPRPDGGAPYESGTVFEIETALARRREAPLPDVALFRKRAPPDQALSGDAAEELARHLRLMEEVTRQWQRTDTGAFKAAINSFTNPDEFERKFEQHLRGWLTGRGHGADDVVWRIRDQEGRDCTPYPGLEAYDAEHASVFCGRDQAVELCLQDLRAAARRDCAFLLLLGASGSGKSSLARAGLLPRLDKPGSTPGVDGWRKAVFTPGQNPLSALAQALFAALPELAAGDSATASAWAATVRGHAAAAAGSVTAALRRAGAAGPQRLNLLLLADQLEEAFAAAPAEREAFAAALAALARSGVAWVVATLRDDRYAGLMDQPLLLALKRDGATHDLAPPEGAELEAIIRKPARLSSLTFERGADGRDLAEALRRDVTDADALPLLQMTLAKLFEARDRDSGTMTFRSYRELGGLAGAIDKRAKEVFARADPAAAAELPALLLGLVGGVAEDGRVLAREAPAAALAATPARRALLELLVEGRLLLTDGREAPDGSRQVWVRVAHEALLRNWQRAVAILAPEPLRAKPRVEQAQRDWQAGGERKADLLRGTVLEGAQKLLEAHGAALPEALRDFVLRSLAARKRQKLWEAWRWPALVGAIVVLGLGFWGWNNQVALQQANERTEQEARLAAEQRDRAESEARLAATAAQERDAALRQQARATAILAEQAIDRGDAMTGMLAALAALPERGERPWSADAASALRRGVLMNREMFVFTGHSGPVSHAAFSPDGRRLVTASHDRTVRLWDLNGERPVATVLVDHTLVDHTGSLDPRVISVVTFSQDGRSLLTVPFHGTVKLWDLSGERPTATELMKLVSLGTSYEFTIVDAQFSPDGRRLVTAMTDHSVWLWDLSGTQPVGITILRGHSHRVWHVGFSPDGERLVTASEDGTVRLWDLSGTQPTVTVLRAHTDAVVHAAFSPPDGQRLVTVSRDRTARLWDLSGTQPTATVLGEHAGAVVRAAFSPDGQRLVTASWDRTARLWDLSGPSPTFIILEGHASGVHSAAFSPDGQRLVTASDDNTARLWDLSGTQPTVTVLGAHTQAVVHAAFSPDGQRLVTASWDGTARLWDVGSELPDTRAVVVRTNAERNILVRPSIGDARSLLIASNDSTARLVSLGGERPVITFLTGISGRVNRAAISPDARYLVIEYEHANGEAQLWDLSGERPVVVTVLRGHTASIANYAFSLDERRLVTVSLDSTARIWDLSSGQPVAVLVHPSAVENAALSPDGRRLATASARGAWLWNLEGTMPVGNVLGTQLPSIVTSAEFSPDGQRLVMALDDGTVRLWEMSGARPVATDLAGHLTRVSRTVFSPDGQRLLTGDWNAKMILWDLRGAPPVGTFLPSEIDAYRDRRPIINVIQAAFSPNGQSLVTVRGDGRTQLWDLGGSPPGSLVLPGYFGRVTGAAFSPDERRLVTTSDDGTARLYEIPMGQELLALARSRLTRCLSDAQRATFGLPPHPRPAADRDHIRPPTEC